MTNRMHKTRILTRKSRRLNLELLEPRLCLSTYTTVDLTPLEGELQSWAYGLNDNGLVVGASSHAAVVWSVGQAGNGEVVNPVQLEGLIERPDPEIDDGSLRATEVNNQGMIAGGSQFIDVDGITRSHAVVWTNSSGSYEVRDLGTPAGFDGSDALSLSEPDSEGNVWVVGVSGKPDQTPYPEDPNPDQRVSHGVLWKVEPNGTIQMFDLEPDFPTPDESFVSASDVNVSEDGQSVLVAGSQSGEQAIIWTVNLSGQVVNRTLLGTDDVDTVQAYGLNNDGDAVGWAWAPFPDDYGFLYEGGETIALGSLGNQGSCALGINDNDVVVGRYTHVIPPSSGFVGDDYAFVWEDGTMYDLCDQVSDRTFWRLSSAADVNDNGEIVG